MWEHTIEILTKKKQELEIELGNMKVLGEIHSRNYYTDIENALTSCKNMIKNLKMANETIKVEKIRFKMN